ncbi:MAG: nucleoside phosphorylase [Methanobacteriota archaeon]|nr:MAG: nucleoside phosphorylase [Euryarchaeota archaeon]
MNEKDQRGIALLAGPPSENSVLNPIDLIEYGKELHGIGAPKIPPYCVLAFFKEMYEHVEKTFHPEVIYYFSEKNPMFDPIHVFDYEGVGIAFVFPGIASPQAAAILEFMIAFGGEYFISIGGVGTLSTDIKRGDIILPTRALRDEGTSFHYEKPSRYSYPSDLMLEYVRKSLKENNVPYREGGTWTTDAFFRETVEKVEEFYKEGCLTVEMETSALFSVAKYRNKHIGGLFTAGDCVGGPRWDSRREKGDKGTVQRRKVQLLDRALDALRLLSSNVGKE